VITRYGQAQRLERDQRPVHVRVGPAPADLEVCVPAVQRRPVRLVPDLGELEADAGTRGPETADQVRHQPGAERLLEGQHHGAGIGVDELADRRDPVVEMVQQRVQVRLEHRARVRHAQRAAAAPQQWRADLRLQPRQCPRHARLRDRLGLADIGHRGPVRHLLEPAQRIRVHTYDHSSWISCYPVIGRIDAYRAHWKVNHLCLKGKQMPPITRPRPSLLTALRGQFEHSRAARATRRALERELATYTSQSDLDDLHAILDRHSDQETADIRRILARRAA
jgi:hypothetical protein